MIARVNVYLVLAILVAGTVFYMVGFRHFSHLTQQTQLAKAEYQSAISYSQVQLSTRLQGLAKDKVLAANLEWGLQHSVKKELEAQLEANQLEELQIVKPNCEVLIHASIKQKYLDRCALSITSTKQIGQFIWLNEAKEPVLLLVLPLQTTGNNRVFLAGTVAFNQQWLNAQLGLQTYVKELGLAVAPKASDVPLLINSVPALSTDNFWLSLFPALRYGAWHEQSPVLFYLLVLTLSSGLGWLWHQQRTQRRSATEQQQSFLAWVKKQTGGGNPGGGLSQAETKGELTYGQARCWVEGYVEAQSQRLRSLQQESAALRSTLESQKVQIAGLIDQLDKATLQGSAAEILVDNKGRIQSLIRDLDSKCEDLEDIASHGMRRAIETLLAILKPWRQEIDQRGVRRFWRALAEKQTERGTSLLEEQLTLLDQISSRVADQLVNHSLKTQQLRQMLHDLSDIGGQLEQAVDPTNGQPAESVIDAVCSAQDLLAVAPELFSNHFPFDAQLLQAPPIPKAALILSIQALYRNLLQLESREGPIMTTVKKDKSGNTLWLLSCETTGPVPKGDLLAARARNLLKDYPITVELLPLTSGAVNIALKWRESGPRANKAEKTLAEGHLV